MAAAPTQADTSGDCIAAYQGAKTVFDTSSANADLNCVKVGNSLNMFLNADSPENCEGEDEWHLMAKAIANGKDSKGGGACEIRLHGSDGEGCGTPKNETRTQC